MEKVDYFFDILSQSTVCFIGYSFKQERVKDEIVSKIPHFKIGEIDSSFSFKSLLRDRKLNQLLNNESDKNVHWIVLDICDIAPSSRIGEKQTVIKNIISKIRSDIFTTNYKLLITSPTYRSPSVLGSSNTIGSFIGGTTPFYVSDIVAILSESDEDSMIIKNRKKSILNIIKNRHDSEKVISLDGLENYNYLCDDYPHFINKNNEISY